MQTEIIITGDGSHSVYVPGLNVTYHSKHGAIQESQHVFIQSGLSLLLNRNQISIFEMGFGTGLNALLSFIAVEKTNAEIYYETVEMFPLNRTETAALNYPAALNRPDLKNVFMQMHSQSWNISHSMSQNFTLCKRQEDITDIQFSCNFDIIYFDAFDPVTQPSLWTKHIFAKLYKTLHAGGLLLTYCSKGSVRRAMQEAGFVVEKVPGPKGKREIVRAIKH